MTANLSHNRSVDSLPSLSEFISDVEILSMRDHPHVSFVAGSYRPEAYQDGMCIDASIRLPECIATATRKRRAEYVAGRYTASVLLREENIGRYHLASGRLGEPLWPASFIGSLTHNEGTVLACGGHASLVGPMGVDVQAWLTDTASRAVQRLLLHDDERRSLGGRPLSEAATMILSAKECFYKLVSPLLGRPFELRALQVELPRSRIGTFYVSLSESLSDDFSAGREFVGTVNVLRGKVLTFIAMTR